MLALTRTWWDAYDFRPRDRAVIPTFICNYQAYVAPQVIDSH